MGRVRIRLVEGFGQKNFPKQQMRSAGARVARKNASKKGSGAEQAK